MSDIDKSIFRVFDTETTGLAVDTDRVVEVAYVDVMKGVIIGKNQSLINPGIPIPATASAIHHIVDEDVQNASRLSDFMARITDNFIPVAHNAAFDSAFLPEIKGPWLCAMRLAKHLWPDAPSHSNQVLRYWLKLTVPQAQGLPAHRALADCYVTAALLAHQLELIANRGIAATGEELIAYANTPTLQTKIGFGKHFGTPWNDLPMDYLQWMAGKQWDDETTYTLRHELNRRRL